MAWIETVPPEEATGTLKRLYAEAVRRAGKVYNVIRLQSPRPHVLRASIQLYQQIMHSPESGLSRAEREMIATTVSRVNGCFYWTEAHAEDLRVEVEDREDADGLIEQIKLDYCLAALSARERAILDYAVKLTLHPSQMRREDVEALRAQGLDDASVHDVAQVTGFFNLYNRLADGLGIEAEPNWWT